MYPLMATLLMLSRLARAPALDDPVAITERYLEALVRFDHATMAQLREWPAEEQARLKAMRSFERATSSKWTWQIIAVRGAVVHVLETEDNTYYQLLGVGRATQIVAYRIGRGRIVSAESEFHVNASGDQSTESRRFTSWMLAQPNGPDPEVVGDGGLRFAATSAPKLLKWLAQWKAIGRP